MLLAMVAFAFTSCALRPISSNYDYQQHKSESVNIDNLGNGKILIYNDADALHKLDNTARINLWINEQPMGQLRSNEYAILELKKGTYDIKMAHIDMAMFKNTKKVIIDDQTKVIRIKATAVSNELIITNELPSNLKKIKYVKKR